MAIETSTQQGVCIIKIARADKKNALTVAMYQAMADAICAAREDATVRALVLHGDRHVFTAGNDLEDFLKQPPQGQDAPVFQFMRAMLDFDKPFVVAVNGPAVGIGTTLLLHADFVYAADDAKFSMPFVNLGLCAEFASSVLAPATMGYARAAEKLLLGEPFSAQDAYEMGIATRVLPPEEVLSYAIRQAQRFNDLPPTAVRTTKRLMRQPQRAMLEQVIVNEAQHFGKLLHSAEAKEAFTAFMERRKPNFAQFS